MLTCSVRWMLACVETTQTGIPSYNAGIDRMLLYSQGLLYASATRALHPTAALNSTTLRWPATPGLWGPRPSWPGC